MIADVCPNCGKMVPDRNGACPSCGMKRRETGESTKKNARFPTPLIVVIVLTISGIVMAGVLTVGLLVVPYFFLSQNVETSAVNQPDEQIFVNCRSNCKNIATALEMYANDNNGQYPFTLDKLVSEGYISVIPECPAAKRDTYSQSYTSTTNPHEFTFYCEGEHHMSDTEKNYPQYNSTRGLIPKPGQEQE